MWFGWQCPPGIEQGHIFALKATKSVLKWNVCKPQMRLVLNSRKCRWDGKRRKKLRRCVSLKLSPATAINIAWYWAEVKVTLWIGSDRLDSIAVSLFSNSEIQITVRRASLSRTQSSRLHHTTGHLLGSHLNIWKAVRSCLSVLSHFFLLGGS